VKLLLLLAMVLNHGVVLAEAKIALLVLLPQPVAMEIVSNGDVLLVTTEDFVQLLAPMTLVLLPRLLVPHSHGVDRKEVMIVHASALLLPLLLAARSLGEEEVMTVTEKLLGIAKPLEAPQVLPLEVVRLLNLGVVLVQAMKVSAIALPLLPLLAARSPGEEEVKAPTLRPLELLQELRHLLLAQPSLGVSNKPSYP